MDPVSAIGLVASIITLLDLAEPLARRLGPSSHNKQELSRMIQVLIASKRSYESLRNFFKDGEQESTMSEYIAEPEKQCIEVLSYLRKRLENQTFVDRYILGGRWDKILDKSIKILEDAKNLFEQAMQIDQYKTSITVLKTIQEHVENSTNCSEDIIASVDSTAERLDDLVVRIHDQHAEVKGWYNENFGMLEDIADEIMTWKDEKDRKLRDEIVRWLCNTDPSTNQEEAVKRHESSTGSWFIDSDLYKDWMREARFIWLQGIVGCGKTILCSSAIEAIQKYCDTTSNATLAYFYFSYTDANKQKASHFIRSILGQFVYQKATTPKVLKDLYATHKHGTPPTKLLLSVLDTVLQVPGENFLIIDALDECPIQGNGRDDLCEYLRYLASLKRLHILATGRKQADLEDGLSGIEDLVPMPFRNSNVDADIRLYVKSQLETNPRFQRMKWLPKVHNNILETLERKSNGMFRWAFCQLETIKSCRNTKDVHQRLASLPKDLDETYSRILEAIPEDDREVARIALQWLAFSNRPLTIKELAEAAVIDTAQEPAFEEENRFEDPSDILRILSSLVTVQNERRGVYNEEDDFTSSLIVLGHFSIKEYLTSNRLPTSVQRFAMGHDICHRYLTKSCLLYNAHFLALLAQEDVQFKAIERGHLAYSMLTHNSNCIPGRAPRYKLPCDHNRFPLLEYSRIEWTRHIQEWALDTDPECNNLIFRALTSPSWNTLWDVWKGTTLLSTEKIMLSPGSGCPLLVAVYFDLYEVCSMMLAAGKDPNTDVLFTPENESWTLLEAAVNNGNEKIVKLLIDAGGEVNYRRSRRSNLRTLEVHSCLLHMAVRSGKTYLVQLLIDSGINAGSCDDKEYTYFHGRYRKVSPLETAASQRKWDIFRIIFDHGRDVDLNNALEIASCMGEWEIFDDLIDSKDGVDVNYAASIAAENHNCQAVEHLLKRGADVHELHRLAVEWDDNELVEFLLKERQEYTPDTGDYDRLLHTAMAWGNNNPAVVKLLLEHGANANASGGWAGSALQQVAALDRGFHLKKMELLKLLLEYGANPNIQRTGKEASSMTSGRTPLQIILLEGLNFSFSLVIKNTLEQIKFLLDNGALIHPPGRDNEDWSSLQRIMKILPLEARITDLVRLLLEYGAKLDPLTDPRLSNAAEDKDFALLAELLLEKQLHGLEIIHVQDIMPPPAGIPLAPIRDCTKLETENLSSKDPRFHNPHGLSLRRVELR